MNMNKSLIALAVAGVFATSAAVADVSIYGQANVSYDFVDNDGHRDSNGVGSNASRLGFKGSKPWVAVCPQSGKLKAKSQSVMVQALTIIQVPKQALVSVIPSPV